MHSFKSYLLIFAIYLYSSSFLYGQTPTTSCGAAIAPPAATTVCSGTQLTATPSGNFFYQWQKDGVNIANANTRTLPLEESGSYRVIVRGASCAADTSDAVAMTVNKEEALFSIEKRERVNPQSADTCGIPVKVTLKNESTPATGLTYAWEILEGEDPADPKFVKYVDGTSATSQNPILQFYKKGQYTVKLRIKGPCFDPANPDGPVDPVDPDNPDAESDGRYVHEETVVIVYPQVQPQGFEECEDPTPGATITLSGSQLATLDFNLGTLRPGSITWTTTSPGVTISDPKIENPQITFPKIGTHVLSVRFANECEFSDALPGSQVTRIEVTFSPRPPKPVLSRTEAFVCAGGTYELAPTLNDPRKLYNFYANQFSTTPLNTGGPAPSYFAGPVNGRTVIYVAAIEGQCESLERAVFTLNEIQQDINNSITADQSICANTKPVALSGSNAQVGTNRPIYLWESKATGAAAYTPAAGTNNQQSYSPEALTETTAFRRTVTFEGCDIPNLSNEVTIEVLPVIDPSTNIIQANKTVVCKGDVPTLTGNLISGDIDYVWESSTTSATAGFIPAVGSDNKNGAQFIPGFITQTTWYRRTARYKNTQCEPVPSSEVIQVTIDELPAAPAVKATTASTCQGGSAVLEVVPGTTTGLTYVWYTESSGGTPVGSGSPFNTPPLTQNTTFYVEAVNANKCVSQQRTSVLVTVLPITADAGRDTTIIEGQSITLRGTGAAGSTFTWSPATGLSNPNVPNPVATPTKDMTYTLTVTNGDQECVATDEVTITVIPRIKIVNTFSPNRDGVNEYWEIENIQNFPEASVEIFNRYGAQVFKSNGYSQPWDGTHNGNPLPLATYYYIIRLNKTEKPFTGSVTIIK